MSESKTRESISPVKASLERVDVPPWEVHACKPFAETILNLELDRESSIEELCRRHPSESKGRSQTAILEIDGSRVRLHLRPVRHGGALSRLTGGRLQNLDRPLAELSLTAELHHRDSPVPEPAFVMGRKVGAFWEAAVCTVHQEDYLDGVAFLDLEPGEALLSAAARAAGVATRELHDAGCRHADLHIQNLLFRDLGSQRSSDAQAEPRVDVVIIDLDGARLVADVTPARRMREIMRLYRSLVKRDFARASSSAISEAFFSAYVADDHALRNNLLDFLNRERRRVRAHSLFYRRGDPR